MRKFQFILGLACSVFALSFTAGSFSCNVYADEQLTENVDPIGDDEGDTATLEEVIYAQSEKPSLYLAPQFSDNEQLAINYISNAFEKGETVIDISQYKIKTDRLPTIIEAAKRQEPTGWAAHKYLSGYSYGYRSSTDFVTYIQFSSDYDSEKISERYETLNKKVAEIVASVPSDFSEEEIVLYLHDYLVYNCAYDMVNYENNSLPSDVYSAYGALVNQSAVCQGYSEAMCLLLK